MRKVGLLILIFLLIAELRAQRISQKDSLDINAVCMLVYSNGQLSHDTANGLPGYIVPKNIGTNAVYTMDLWIAGRDVVSLDTHLIADPYSDYTLRKREGPVADNYNNSHRNKYGRLWKLNKTEIDNHRNNWFVPFYSMNPTIASWPAHGDTTNGEAYYLAPFIDFNQNGKYDPQNGDYPCIKGDQAVYTISNDDRIDAQYDRSPFPLEIHLMVYGFITSNALNNTTFLEYKVINRNANAYENVYVGFWNDMAVGCASDDYIGCDSSFNMYYGFNGDLFDEDCYGTLGYGSILPFVGTTFLNHEMKSFTYYDRGRNPLRGDPSLDKDYYNYLQSIWKDGSPMVVGGNGHPSDTNSTSQKTKYMFSADPRDTINWNEFTAGNAPFNRRGVGATGPFTIQPNESIELAFAIVFSQDSTSTGLDYLNAFDPFKKDVSFVRNFYNNNIGYCSYWATGEEEISWKNDIKLFPNPANNVLNIQLPEGDLNLNIEVYDAFGKTVHKSYLPNGIKYEIDVSSWTKGMYFIRIYNASNAWVEKVMVE